MGRAFVFTFVRFYSLDRVVVIFFNQILHLHRSHGHHVKDNITLCIQLKVNAEIGM